MQTDAEQPTVDQIQARYLEYRACGRRFNHEIAARLEGEALDAAARRLGMLEKKEIVLGSEHDLFVLYDHALYWPDDADRTPIERYFDEFPQQLGSLEATVAEGMRQACFSVVRFKQVFPGLGAEVLDLHGNPIVLVDIGLSVTLVDGAALASRLIPLPGFCMTGGAALPVNALSGQAVSAALRTAHEQLGPVQDESTAAVRRQASQFEAVTIKALLRAGASGHVVTSDVLAEPMERGSSRARRGRSQLPQHTSPNAPCPCASGRKYKKCCGRVGVR